MTRSLGNMCGGACLVLALCGCGGDGTGESVARYRSEIIGGDAAPEATNIVVVVTNDGALACTGALIAPNVVLVPRVCASATPGYFSCPDSEYGANYDPSTIKVTNADVPDLQSTWWAVTSVATPNNPQICGNSVALLVLQNNVPSSEAAPLEPRIDSPVVKGELLTAYGYGALEPNKGETSGVRRSLGGVPVTQVSSDGQFQTGTGPCGGDGPGVGSDGLLAGVVFAGDEMCTYGIWQSFAMHANWIRETVAAAATAGGYAVPQWVSEGLEGGVPADAGGTGGSDGDAGQAGGGGQPGSGGSSGAAGTGGSDEQDASAEDSGAADSGTADANGAAPEADDSGGCGCRVAHSPSLLGGVLIGIAAVAVALRRRTRGGQRQSRLRRRIATNNAASASHAAECASR